MHQHPNLRRAIANYAELQHAMGRNNHEIDTALSELMHRSPKRARELRSLPVHLR